ncbi:hypothetical protein OG618_37350 (plasmid) [Kitasatospora sp. NBC_01246]|uniref:hypothetical protein n=1 Tax=Kitasatospora sp. NBC_01246 TaxID=2903570 RepID=UPI002E31CEA0|nr:hypothetical protein [Kitasatospora sp. NBC_01246]
MTSSHDIPGADFLIRAIDTGRPLAPWEDPTIPGTEFPADTLAEAEAHLPRIRAAITHHAEITGTLAAAARIVAVEYHGIAPVTLVHYAPTETPDDETALIRRLVADDPAETLARDMDRLNRTRQALADQGAPVVTDSDLAVAA